MFVAITGNIGSGKSFACNYIKKQGFEVIDLDNVTKIAYDNEIIKGKINEVFNCLIDGKIDKEKLKAKLNDENIKKLNDIIHPFVKDYIQKYKIQDKLIFCEVQLLFETDFYKEFDKTIALITDDKLRKERLIKRDINNYELMLKLDKYHLKNDLLAKKADYLIKNSGDDEKLFEQINNIIDLLMKLK